MDITVDKKNGAQTSLKVEVPWEIVAGKLEQAFRRLAKNTRIPGFRKGRAPRKLFELRFGTKDIEQEALKNLFPEVFREAIKKEKLNPIMTPEIKVVQFSKDKPLVLKMEVVGKPEVKLGTYRGLKIKKNKIEVTKKEVISALEDFQRKYTQYPLVEKRDEVEERDWLIMNWQAFYQGKKLSGKEGENFAFQVGSSVFPVKFSSQIIGMRVSQSKNIEVEFPSEYPRADFRNRKIKFQIELKEIREEKRPPLNDDFAKNLKFENLEDMKDHLREQIKKIKENLEERRKRYDLVDQVVNSAQLEISPLLLKRKTKERIQKIVDNLREKGLTLPEYLKQEKLDEKQFQEKVEGEVEKDLQGLFVLDRIAQNEKVKVTEEELNERLRVLAKGKWPEEIENIKESLSARGQLEEIKMRIRHEKVIEFLYNHSKSSAKAGGDEK